MRIAIATFFLVSAGFIIALKVRRARVEGRPVKVFDDVVDALGLPFLIVPQFLPLPSVAAKPIMAVGAAIILIGLWRLVRSIRAEGPSKPRVDDAPPGR